MYNYALEIMEIFTMMHKAMRYGVSVDWAELHKAVWQLYYRKRLKTVVKQSRGRRCTHPAFGEQGLKTIGG